MQPNLSFSSSTRYEILDPDSYINENHEDLDIGNLLSKMVTPTPTTSFNELLESFFSMFITSQPHSPSDVSGIQGV